MIDAVTVGHLHGVLTIVVHRICLPDTVILDGHAEGILQLISVLAVISCSVGNHYYYVSVSKRSQGFL